MKMLMGKEEKLLRRNLGTYDIVKRAVFLLEQRNCLKSIVLVSNKV